MFFSDFPMSGHTHKHLHGYFQADTTSLVTEASTRKRKRQSSGSAINLWGRVGGRSIPWEWHTVYVTPSGNQTCQWEMTRANIECGRINQLFWCSIWSTSLVLLFQHSSTVVFVGSLVSQCCLRQCSLTFQHGSMHMYCIDFSPTIAVGGPSLCIRVQ